MRKTYREQINELWGEGYPHVKRVEFFDHHYAIKLARWLNRHWAPGTAKAEIYLPSGGGAVDMGAIPSNVLRLAYKAIGAIPKYFEEELF